MSIKGIDVSSIQGTGFSTSGMSFCFVKATEGHTYINPDQSAQAAKARKAGLVVGFYHFLWPGNIQTQAEYFVEKCASVVPDVLICDWETTSEGTAASCAQKDQFLAAVKKLRPTHRVVLYCNRDFWLNHDTTSNAGHGLWIAQYGVPAGKPEIKAAWKFHQYTSSPLDTSVGEFASKAALASWAGELAK
jgi:GH25 family lysozyme M1 (1,4-beta-N-acetylmuramidase)